MKRCSDQARRWVKSVLKRSPRTYAILFFSGRGGTAQAGKSLCREFRRNTKSVKRRRTVKSSRAKVLKSVCWSCQRREAKGGGPEHTCVVTRYDTYASLVPSFSFRGVSTVHSRMPSTPMPARSVASAFSPACGSLDMSLRRLFVLTGKLLEGENEDRSSFCDSCASGSRGHCTLSKPSSRSSMPEFWR